MVQHNKLDEVMSKCSDIFKDIGEELARNWEVRGDQSDLDDGRMSFG